MDKTKRKAGIWILIASLLAVLLLNWKKILAAVIVLLAAIIAIFEPSEKTFPVEYIGENLNIDISAGNVVQNTDTHGGLLGDGRTIVAIEFTESNGQVLLEEIIQKGWKPLPLSENMTKAIYGQSSNSRPYFCDETGEPFLPEIENGYYIFMDRFSESVDPSDDSPLFSRASYNFTLAIFDSDNHTLYYFMMDT